MSNKSTSVMIQTQQFKLFTLYRKIIGIADGLFPLHSPYQFQTNHYYGYYPTMNCKWLFSGYLRN